MTASKNFSDSSPVIKMNNRLSPSVYVKEGLELNNRQPPSFYGFDLSDEMVKEMKNKTIKELRALKKKRGLRVYLKIKYQKENLVSYLIQSSE